MIVLNAVSLGVMDGSKHYTFQPSSYAKKCLLYRYSCGYFLCNKNYYEDRFFFDSYLFAYVTEGEIFYLDDNGEIFHAKKGELLLINCYRHHIYGTKSSAKFYWMHIDGNGIENLFNELIDFSGNVMSGKIVENMGEFIISSVKNCEGGVENTEINIAIQLYALMCELHGNNVPEKYDRSFNNFLNALYNFFNKNYMNNITVKDIANYIHISEAHLSRLCSKYTNMPPYELLQKYRINVAKELLLKSDATVKEITFKTGYNSESNFIYAFKREEGMSPGKYKKSNKK